MEPYILNVAVESTIVFGDSCIEKSFLFGLEAPEWVISWDILGISLMWARQGDDVDN